MHLIYSDETSYRNSLNPFVTKLRSITQNRRNGGYSGRSCSIWSPRLNSACFQHRRRIEERGIVNVRSENANNAERTIASGVTRNFANGNVQFDPDQKLFPQRAPPVWT